jgi:hypothetical protein
MGPEYCQKSYQPWLFYVHKRGRVSTSEKAGIADKACRSDAGSIAKAAGSETGSSDRTGGSDTDSSWASVSYRPKISDKTRSQKKLTIQRNKAVRTQAINNEGSLDKGSILKKAGISNKTKQFRQSR